MPINSLTFAIRLRPYCLTKKKRICVYQLATLLTLDIKTTLFLSYVGRDDTDSEDLSPTSPGELERREQPQQSGGGGVADVTRQQTN